MFCKNISFFGAIGWIAAVGDFSELPQKFVQYAERNLLTNREKYVITVLLQLIRLVHTVQLCAKCRISLYASGNLRKERKMFDIDLQSRMPIYEQLYKRVAAMTIKRELRAGDRLPSVRELAKELGVNPNTVSKAFQMLERDGLINTVPGRGSFISGDSGEAVKEISRESFARAVKDAFGSGITRSEMVNEIDKAEAALGKNALTAECDDNKEKGEQR